MDPTLPLYAVVLLSTFAGAVVGLVLGTALARAPRDAAPVARRPRAPRPPARFTDADPDDAVDLTELSPYWHDHPAVVIVVPPNQIWS